MTYPMTVFGSMEENDGRLSQISRHRHHKNIFLFRISDLSYKQLISPTEGRSYVVTNAGWDAVDAGSVGAKAFAGRV